MQIGGLQKLTLLDFPEKVSCTVFTCGCNLRCPYCHNPSLVLPQFAPNQITEADFFTFLQKRQGLLDGVCISGGEPLLQPDIIAFVTRVKEMGFSVKLDTNGTRPELLRHLAENHMIDYVAMDIKHAPSRYAEAAGVNAFDLSPVRESTAFLLQGGLPYEFRTTVAHPLHTSDDFDEIGQWLRGAQRYFIQPFEDTGSLVGQGLKPCTDAELAAFLATLQAHIPVAQLRNK